MVYLYNNLKLKDNRKKLRSNMPEPEQILWYYLRGKNLGQKFRRQYSVGSYILDFYCPTLRLGIEIDGDSHFTNTKVENDDLRRDRYFESQNVKVIRFTNIDVTQNVEAVLEKILENMVSTTPSPSYSRRGIK